MSNANQAPLFLGGPTASGKSEVALHLARRLGGEIISVDSMQVYRGLDIGTAKPSLEERAAVPHHLVDILELTEEFDAAQFASRARQAWREIESRGRTAIFCGGTGLYFKVLLEGFGTAPPASRELRRSLEAASSERLLEELREQDPALYRKIDLHNRRRIVRAVEVIRLSGRRYSDQRASWSRPGSSPSGSDVVFCLEQPRSILRERVKVRVQKMFEQGLVLETEALLNTGLRSNPAALQAIGYRQVVEHLEGKLELDETRELVTRKTWQLARRQMNWFRHQLKTHWVPVEAGLDSAVIAERLEQAWRTSHAIARC